MNSNSVLWAAVLGILASGCDLVVSPQRNVPPQVVFTVSCAELRCSFLDGSSDPDGTIGARAWSFGDGGTSAEANPVHTYAAPGEYTVTLTVTDDREATGTGSRQVAMDLPPRASFDFACSGLTCTLIDGSVDVGGSIVGRSWSFGDGEGSVEPTPTHTYAGSGSYPVTLTVVDDGGNSDTASRIVTVASQPVRAPPVAAFDVACSSATCTFVDRSTDADGAVTAWSWSFGDGTFSAEQHPQHTYDVAALTVMTAQLTVRDADGATSVASQSFTVSPPASLECHDAVDTGALVGCTIVLDRAARIEVELTDRECLASGNSFTVTAPVVTTLFEDGCYEPPIGTVFTLSDGGDPFPAGTVITAQMSSGSKSQVIPPTLIVTGAESPWRLQFDDGEVAPRDLDIVLTFRAVP